MGWLSEHISEINNSVDTQALITCERRNNKIAKLRALIRQVSDKHGGDASQFLNEYTDDVIRGWSHDLDTAMNCFESLL